jgi:hypothetical protein
MVLNTASEIIETLGGVKAVSQLTGSTYAAVWNWKAFQKFPPRTFVILNDALRKQGHDAPARLWGMTEDAA